MFVRAKLPLAVFALTALVAGCEGQFGSKDEDAGASQPAAVVESTPSSSDSSSASTTTGIGTESGFQGHPLDDPASPLAKRTVYFEFDSSEMKEEDRYILEAHAGYLAGNSQATVTLEGHADERGTREYNIALGERRAKAVRQLMGLLGASVQQAGTVSFGEERPAAEGHEESAWKFNRRVEIIYRAR